LKPDIKAELSKLQLTFDRLITSYSKFSGPIDTLFGANQVIDFSKSSNFK